MPNAGLVEASVLAVPDKCLSMLDRPDTTRFVHLVALSSRQREQGLTRQRAVQLHAVLKRSDQLQVMHHPGFCSHVSCGASTACDIAPSKDDASGPVSRQGACAVFSYNIQCLHKFLLAAYMTHLTFCSCVSFIVQPKCNLYVFSTCWDNNAHACRQTACLKNISAGHMCRTVSR